MSLSSARRKKMPLSDFALPGRRGYPDDTKGRARNALARAAQFATPAEKAKIQAKVHRDWPEIGKAKTAYHARKKARAAARG